MVGYGGAPPVLRPFGNDGPEDPHRSARRGPKTAMSARHLASGPGHLASASAEAFRPSIPTTACPCQTRFVPHLPTLVRQPCSLCWSPLFTPKAQDNFSRAGDFGGGHRETGGDRRWDTCRGGKGIPKQADLPTSNGTVFWAMGDPHPTTGAGGRLSKHTSLDQHLGGTVFLEVPFPSDPPWNRQPVPKILFHGSGPAALRMDPSNPVPMGNPPVVAPPEDRDDLDLRVGTGHPWR